MTFSAIWAVARVDNGPGQVPGASTLGLCLRAPVLERVVFPCPWVRAWPLSPLTIGPLLLAVELHPELVDLTIAVLQRQLQLHDLAAGAGAGRHRSTSPEMESLSQGVRHIGNLFVHFSGLPIVGPWQGRVLGLMCQTLSDSHYTLDPIHNLLIP